MKILFLDIDGVLNSSEYAKGYYEEKLQNKGQHIWVDPYPVSLIKEFCEKNDIKIIISSSWRGFGYDDTIKNLNVYRDLSPLLKFIVGITPRTIERHRGKEIKLLIDNWDRYVDNGLIHDGYRNERIEKYAIIDDDNDMLDEQKEHFVRTDNLFGATEDDIEELEKILL